MVLPIVVALLEGLSPRVRGSREAKVDVVFQRGSIPACAGEPWRP